jgi:proline iminopeptidase
MLSGRVIFILGFLVTTQAFASTRIEGLYVNTFGDSKNQALIFVHGGPGFNSWDYELTTGPVLAKLGFYIVTFDERGQGRSEPVDESAYNYKQYADDIKMLIDKMKLNKPVLLGHSHGGPISIQFETFYPNVVEKIVLISAPVRFESSMHALINHCSETYQQKGDLKNLSDIAWVDYTIFSDKSQSIDDLANATSYAFYHGLGCGLYSAKSPTAEAVSLHKLTKENPVQGDLTGDKAVLGFLKNENYIKSDLSTFVYQHQDRFCGIYGDEDGLFTATELAVIRNLLQRSDGTSPMQVIRGASHSVYVDQQADFISALKDTCKLRGVN